MNSGNIFIGEEKELADKKSEVKGKSWKREREERGRRQQLREQNQFTSADNLEIQDILSISSDDQVISDARNNVCFQEEIKKEINDSMGGKKGWGDDWKRKTKENSIEEEGEIIDTNDSKQEEIYSCEDNTFEEIQKNDKEPDSCEEDEFKRQLEIFLSDTTERLAIKAELRTANSNASVNRPEESFFSKLDSSLKKNTAFIKRLRNMTEAQRESLIKDMSGLNLTKYISEAAAAIVDAKLKMSDVNMAVQVCSLLHQRYADFSTQLLENWQKVLPLKKDEKITNPSKIRVDLRFYAELITCGVFTLKEGLPLLGNLLTILTSGDKEEHNNLNIILSFIKHCGEDYADLIPRKMRVLAEKFNKEFPKSDLLPPDRQKGLRSLLKEYYKSLCKHLVRDHKNLQAMERQNRRILQTKGELNMERKEKYEASQVAFQKLLSSTQQFADIVDEDLPELPKDELAYPDTEITNLDVHNRFKDGEFEGLLSVWEDEDTRSFYENLPDLKAFIPGILFKDSAQILQNQQNDIQNESNIEEDLTKLEIEEVELLETEEEKSEESKIEIPTKPEESDLTETLMHEMEEPEEEGSSVASTTNRLLLDGYLATLLNCVNREMIDQAAVDFCMNLNTKPNRRKLVRALFLVPRTRLDLLPFYARFVAILYPCMPDVANDLVAMLKQDFKFHIKKKDQINIESKVKTVRFIGELVKFKMFSKSDALCCLKMLLFEFTHHHIEMACNLLETCGRFLFRAPESHQRTKVYLEQMMRKKAVMPLDGRYTTMIENAFYYCNPPESPVTVKIERPPVHEYIRKLLYKDLSKNNTEKILRQMRKLNWEDQDISSYAAKCLTAIWNVKYYNIRCVANLLAGLVAYQEIVGPQVVDGVLEDIRLGMEINHPKYHQRRVSMIRYLGELYNYRMVESAVIFRILYLCITFAVPYDGSYSELDPPDNLFRIRLVCILLDTCGQYFNSGSSKKKLDCFLVFFQYYFWYKKSSEVFNEDNFPVTVEFMVKDTISMLRPKLKIYESFEEAQRAVQELMNEYKTKIDSCMFTDELYPNSQHLETENMQSKEGSLGPIQEIDEDQDDGQSEDGSFHDGDGDVDTDMFSLSQSQPIDEENDDADDGEGVVSTSEEEIGHIFDENQDVTIVTAAPKHISCQEDEDFMTAFDKMLSESILHRSQDSIKPQSDIVIPMNIKGGTGKKSGGILLNLKPEEENNRENSTINFVLMTRRGNKQQFKSLEVPVTSELAQNLKDREEAERAEKEQVKKLTLDINERQEEEDYQEMLAAQQRPAVMNLNRDRRQKYHHPKGAPDADLIFGNK